MFVQNPGNPSSFKRALSVALAILLALSSGAVWAAPGESGPALTASALLVESDPAGATVYVDGQFTGQTPLRVTTLTKGDHRVRLVKDGYLENGRVVTIGKDRGQSVQVKLTRRSSSATPEAAAQVSSGGGGSSTKKWIIIGAAAGGGGGAATYLVVKNRNKAPDPGTIAVGPTATGMAGQTTFTFDSNASDQDNDALTYSWNFGDGGSDSGKNPRHVFASAGTFNVTLSVSDGKADTSVPGISVTVARAMTGAWTGGFENGLQCGVNTTFTQTGGVLSGSITFTTGCSGTVNLASGNVSPSNPTYPATVTWVSNSFTSSDLPGSFTMRFTGTTNGDGSSMTGTISSTSSSFGNTLSNATTFRR